MTCPSCLKVLRLNCFVSYLHFCFLLTEYFSCFGNRGIVFDIRDCIFHYLNHGNVLCVSSTFIRKSYVRDFRLPPRSNRELPFFSDITQQVVVQFLFHWITNVIFTIILLFWGWESDSLRASLTGDRIPLGGEIFHTRPERSWCSPNLLYLVCFLGVKRPGHLFNYSPLSSSEVRERVGLRLHSPSRSAWPVIGWTKNISCL